MITGIVVALPHEISSLSSTKIRQGSCVLINAKTLVTRSGAGPENAAKAARLLLAQGAERLIAWGCAAALKVTLRAGDLVLPQTLYAAEKEQYSLLEINSPWLQQTLAQLAAFQPLTGALVESTRIVTQAADKKTIQQQTQAIALDMESVAVAKIAKQNAVDVLVIRCIADPASMDLPRAVCYALNQQGNIVMPKLFWFLLTHVQELPRLIALGLSFNAAHNTLKQVAKQLATIVNLEQQTRQ